MWVIISLIQLIYILIISMWKSKLIKYKLIIKELSFVWPNIINVNVIKYKIKKLYKMIKVHNE